MISATTAEVLAAASNPGGGLRVNFGAKSAPLREVMLLLTDIATIGWQCEQKDAA